MNKTSRRIAEAIALAIISGTLFFAIWLYGSFVYAEKAYTPTNLLLDEATLPLNYVRLHVIGNSNSDEDQAIKMGVRDEIYRQFSFLMDGVQSAEEAEEILDSYLGEIEETAKKYLEASDKRYGVKVRLGKDYFPDKNYSMQDGTNLFLPKGIYQALKITLGEGKVKTGGA